MTILKQTSIYILLMSSTLAASKLSLESKTRINNWYKDETSLRTYLLSYPRSGNTWTRYCLEYLTKRPTIQKENNSIHRYNYPLGFSFDMGTDYEKPPIWKMHNITWFKTRFKSYHPNKETLILIVRNYKEALPRHCGKLNLQLLANKNHHQKEYFVNLELYDRWHPQKRLLVYYEDLILKPEETLEKLLEFLNEDKYLLKDFMNNYEKHKAISLKIYQDCNGVPVTQGNSVIHHSKKIPKAHLEAIDRYIKNTYPHLWTKYLARYAEN